MQREIKFRAWDGKKMIYHGQSKSVKPLHLSNYPDDVFSFPMVSNLGVSMWFYETRLKHATSDHFDHLTGLESAEIMQYTGLKDKQGKEIYEGDIIQVTEKVMEVKFVEGCWRSKYEGFTNYRLYGWVAGCIEVIGNIYENPDLITVPKPGN